MFNFHVAWMPSATGRSEKRVPVTFYAKPMRKFNVPNFARDFSANR